MPKDLVDATEKLNKTKADADDVLDLMGDEKEKFKAVFDNADKHLKLDQATVENFTQKSLLDKNHQERYLQELVSYAAERGDINKIRLPTSDTAAKIQGYAKMTSNELDWISEGQKVKFKDGEGIINDDMIWSDSLDIKLPNGESKLVSIKELELYNKDLIEKIKPEVTYSPSDQTILKKYAEQPKTIKKIFGVEPKIVKDGKGNSWYEFDIPKSFKEGKGEIKAFKNGGKLATAQNGQEMKFYQNGLDWKPKSMQDGGDEIERISINDPRYAELYKNNQVKSFYDGAYNLYDLPEVTVTAPRSYTMDSLRDFTTAALYGAPATAMKLESIPQAAMTEGIEMLRGRPYNFSNVNPNIGYFTSNQRDLSQTMGYEKPEGFLQNAVNFGLSGIDPAFAVALSNPAVRKIFNKAGKEFLKSKTVQNFNPSNLKSQSGLDWSKKWYSDPVTINKRGRGFTDDAVYKLDEYEPKNYLDLLREDGLKEYAEKSLTTAGTSDGTPDRIFINRSRFFPFNKKALESVRVHELSHLVNDNDYDLRSFEMGQLVKPFGFEDASDRIEKSLFGQLDRKMGNPEEYMYYTSPGEIKARMDQARFDLNLSPSDKFTPEMFNTISKKKNWYGMGKYIKDKKSFVDLMNNFWAAPAVGVAVGTQAVDQQKNGGITKDNQGYWNPDNWGKPVEIDSNDITMEGVYEPLLGVSDTGDTKLMKPGKNYKFKGKKVTEYPVAKLGINQLDAQPMKKLNQLLNFTNNPDKNNWLDKYN
jgi:hypothetical protein